jgi:hypothetical protein
MDKFRQRQKQLIELTSGNNHFSQNAEVEAAVQQRRLNERLQTLKVQIEEEILRGNPSHIPDEPGSTKLSYREHCDEY